MHDNIEQYFMYGIQLIKTRALVLFSSLHVLSDKLYPQKNYFAGQSWSSEFF